MAESTTSWLQSTQPDLSPRSLTSSHSEALEALYARLAPWYDALRAAWALSMGRGVEAAIDSWITRYLDPPLSVLDLGCGTGANLARLMRLGLRPRAYVGIDSSPHMLQVAQRRFGHLHQVTFMHMDIMDVDDALGAFDLVICTYALSHIPEPWRAVDVGLARLRPEGKAIFAFIGEPGPSFRKVFKPVEALLTFRPVPREAPVDLGGATELARYDGVTMTAVLFAASSSGAEGG